MPVPFDGRRGFYIGPTYYWPQGCFRISHPYCHGLTPDGCTLSWQDVELEGGGTVAQCVQLCPRVGVAAPIPPPAVAACPPCLSPAAVPVGACTVDIFAEPNFAGESDEFDENRPTLGDWDEAISSIEVKAGTWDFFMEPDYKGEVMRLTPGEYRDLGAKWNNKIGSFMCIDQ
jgi:Beta/Gamma crystallin